MEIIYNDMTFMLSSATTTLFISYAYTFGLALSHITILLGAGLYSLRSMPDGSAGDTSELQDRLLAIELHNMVIGCFIGSLERLYRLGGQYPCF